TDEAGGYRLEDIPPGRYYIVAGRLDSPTYYPGTLQTAGATIVRITPGANLSGLDFVMKDSSAGRAYAPDFGGFAIVSSVTIRLRLTLEDGAKIPVFSAGHYTSPMLRLTPVAGTNASAFPLTGSTIVAPPGEYAVTVEN